MIYFGQFNSIHSRRRVTMYTVRAYRDLLAPDVEVNVRDQWIGDAAYLELVQKTPIPCTDVVLTMGNDRAIYLGKRSTFPMCGIWGFGGRIFFNDKTLEESVARCLQLETGVHLKSKRFVYVCTHFYSWVKVAQGDFPGKNLAITYSCRVTEAEMSKMVHGLSAKEYDREFGIQRFDRIRLIDEAVHPAMLDIYDELFPQRKR